MPIYSCSPFLHISRMGERIIYDDYISLLWIYLSSLFTQTSTRLSRMDTPFRLEERKSLFILAASKKELYLYTIAAELKLVVVIAGFF